MQRIVHFYPLDNAIQASYNAIFTSDKIYPLEATYPLDSVLPPFVQPAPQDLCFWSIREHWNKKHETSLIRDLNSGPLVYKTSALAPELMRLRQQTSVDKI